VDRGRDPLVSLPEWRGQSREPRHEVCNFHRSTCTAHDDSPKAVEMSLDLPLCAGASAPFSHLGATGAEWPGQQS
jgi:hypothetical protein